MNILVTAGNTRAPIDRVRCVTNIFTGRTGANVARTAWVRGHTVTLLTSNPEALTDVPPDAGDRSRLTVIQYSTFDDLTALLHQHTKSQRYDAIVHSAAVSDYLVAGTYGPQPGTFFNARTNEWEGRPAAMAEHRAGKITSTEPELWVRMVRAPKLIDKIRPHWGFGGLLVKFKLEVGLADADLLDVAERSRQQSAADLIVANTLEAAKHWAFVGPVDGRYERVARRELAERLLLVLEHLRRTGSGG